MERTKELANLSCKKGLIPEKQDFVLLRKILGNDGRDMAGTG